ncbi:major facilitator superfamily domain-containing protein [Dactylonectria estremocensis]|uniref:Major facilitator superfamily domain-containing protein n=1 Tax=Dactylonectria estremocensis TaxID=1079267 RepID=A0A9P9FFD5_9HYPO|nr:major facilitator superfamily domain-containing protein [Dactylonectria estremocensis]
MASLWHKFLTAGDPALNQPQLADAGETQVISNEKEPVIAGDGHAGEETVPDADAQLGVQKVQAVTLAWTKGSLIALLVFIWLLFLTNGFRISILYTLAPFVTSEWAQHSLTTVISIVADSMTAACYIPIAKMLDVWGRAESFMVMIGFSTLGLVLMAASHNLATFCAAQVFYQVGFGGVIYTICVLAADATNLRNRGLAFAFTSSPYMITAFAGPKAAEKFYLNISWRWGFGAFAIILPIVATPLYVVLKTNLKKAEKMGLFVKESSGRTWFQAIIHGVVEYDLLGVFLFGGGFTTFLLPFTLATSAPNGWKTDYIIAMIVTGFVVVVIFVLWEMFWSPVPFLNKKFLTDRTVIAACLIDMTYQMSYYCWASYFSSFLMVVNNLTIAEAGYVSNTFSVVSGVLLFIVGYGIRKTGYYKWLFWLAVPLYIFALGLMIHFRTPNGKIGYIVMCEIFISMGGAVFILCMQLAVLAAVDHQHVAAALATLFVSGSIGGAIGNTISGTIWTNTFLPALYRYMPESAAESVPLIYSSVVTQLSYPVGSDERYAIQQAYGYAQTRMLAAGTGLMALSFVWTYMLKNINVSKMSQTRGTVF